MLRPGRITDLPLDVVKLERGGIDGDGVDGQRGTGIFQGIDAAVGAGQEHIERRQDIAAAVEAGERDVPAQVLRALLDGKGVERHFAQRFDAGDRCGTGLADTGRFAGCDAEVQGPLDLVADQDGVAADAALQRLARLRCTGKRQDRKDQQGQDKSLHLKLCS